MNAILPGIVEGARIDRVISARARLEGVEEMAMREDYLKHISLHRMVNCGRRRAHVSLPLFAGRKKCYGAGDQRGWQLFLGRVQSEVELKDASSKGARHES